MVSRVDEPWPDCLCQETRVDGAHLGEQDFRLALDAAVSGRESSWVLRRALPRDEDEAEGLVIRCQF